MYHHTAWFFWLCLYIGGSDWHLGFPDCGKDSQSPIDLAADIETIAKVSYIYSTSNQMHFVG